MVVLCQFTIPLGISCRLTILIRHACLGVVVVAGVPAASAVIAPGARTKSLRLRAATARPRPATSAGPGPAWPIPSGKAGSSWLGRKARRGECNCFHAVRQF